MSKADKLREIFNDYKYLNSEEALDLILEAQSESEADFFITVTDYMLQHQERILAEERDTYADAFEARLRKFKLLETKNTALSTDFFNTGQSIFGYGTNYYNSNSRKMLPGSVENA